ncbi:CdiA family toxin C-terminal domain-containing protein [Enterococcus sp. LJL51]|uniref:CdiA family toxin C-terminal domain-containing protein n=1 Tax=Enterococcus sp. LJL51 TaxID=3416656 RepID=UPI003CEEEC2D
MSIDMFVGASQSQGSSAFSASKREQQSYAQVIQALQEFVKDQELRSEAYDSAKMLYGAVLVPLVQAGVLLSEAVGTACQQFPVDYQVKVDSGDLKSAALQEKIDQLAQQIQEAQALRYGIERLEIPDTLKSSQLMRNALMMERYHVAKSLLEEKLEKLMDFHRESPEIFSEISQLEQLVIQGADQANGSWNAATGVFDLPSMNQLSWTAVIQDKWLARDKRLRGIDDALVNELEDYTVYAMVCLDGNGNPKVFWKLEQDGRGVVNKRLTDYLKRAGNYLEDGKVTFISFDFWAAKIDEGLRNGYDYTTGKDYNTFISGIGKTSMAAYDFYQWLNESELAAALSTLGFAYGSYKLLTASGTKTVENPLPTTVTGTKHGITYSLNRANSLGNYGYTKPAPVIPGNWLNHLSVAEGFAKRGGVKGAHTEAAFNQYFKDQGLSYKEVGSTPHPTIDGIRDMRYQIQQKDHRGIPIEGQFNISQYKKTLIDEAKISKGTVNNWANEAINNGVFEVRKDNKNLYFKGIAKNGLKFEGWKNPDTGDIDSLYPVSKWKD